MRPNQRLSQVFTIIVLILLCLPAAPAVLSAQEQPVRVGVAAVDITPDYPIRLSGFGFRRTESEGITQRIWAKALAFADEEQGPAILITVDNLSISDEITREIAGRLSSKVGLKLERLAITATHTHTAPMLTDIAPTLFGVPIPPEHQERIDRYTREFTDRLEQVALEAVKNIQPSTLHWGIGKVDLAANRRTPGGPVDHDLPALFVRDLEGNVRAVYFSYACHCVTLSDNKISGDWAGFAQESVQKLFPNAIALASVGCGADSNPRRGMGPTPLEACRNQGELIAQEIRRIGAGEVRPITARPEARYARVDVPFDKPRSRAEWEERAKSSDYAVAYHAKVNLARLDRGETLPTQMTYPIQTWLFGEQLAMVFLPGETVVDYSLRLKREFDRARLWVNGYSNEGRCYLPSERILQEGGYEGGHAMIYYDRPQRFAPGVEQVIFDALYKQIPKSFAAPQGTEGTRPTAATDSLRLIHTKPDLEVELVAAEPLIVDPVAIDWGNDGRLWVCEMHDYPAGLDSYWKPGGRIKWLQDTDGDGQYDKSVVFVENIPFPTGLTAWGKGVLICAAPDILSAEDTDSDGKADRISKLFSGFATDNFQARVNSLVLGLDNWIYGANGLLGGTITAGAGLVDFPFLKAPGAEPILNFPPLDIRNRDFRFSPFTGAFETVSGLTQQGRTRDDWGNWFGCDNSRMLLHYPFSEKYLRRNPHVPAPPAIADLTIRNGGNHLFPRSPFLERFNDPEQANRATSAAGVAIYRDTLLGEEYYGNAFTGETVHNLVHREVVSHDDGTLSAARAPDEQESEFLASEDNWFRPVQVRTGPDGALYVVDMYRFLIEHPRWIPARRLAQIDTRAGSDKGRIYRVRPKGKALRPVRDLTKLNAADLAGALDSPNGTERDRVHTELLVRQDPSAISELRRLAETASLPQVRVQALSALDGLGGVPEWLLVRCLKDAHPEVRRRALILAEPRLKEPGSVLLSAVLALTNDSSKRVIRQLAATLGETPDRSAGVALGILAGRHLQDHSFRACALSSATAHCGSLLTAVLAIPPETPGRAWWISRLVATAADLGNEELLAQALSSLRSFEGEGTDALLLLEPILEALDRRNLTLDQFVAEHEELSGLKPRLEAILGEARKLVEADTTPEGIRVPAIQVLGRTAASSTDLGILSDLAAGSSEKVRRAALAALHRRREPEVASQLIARWQAASPLVRSEIASVLLSRPEWTVGLLEAVRDGLIRQNEIAPADRQRLLAGTNRRVKRLANELFGHAPAASRTEVLERYAEYAEKAATPGSPEKGAEIFERNCASCHRLGRVGAEVGPDLAALRGKDAEYWVKNILDPNAVVEPRFVTYEVELKDGRSLAGIVRNEDSSGLALVMGGGVTETIPRKDIEAIRASNLSLMPEGLEAALSPDQMADLIAFLQQEQGRGGQPRGNPELVLRDPVSVARLILDPKQASELRETAIGSNPQFAPELIAEMTRDLTPGTPEEYERIPWIWRVAIAAGRRNDAAQIKRILKVSLPRADEPLRDWQAVVVGGGIINGISQRDQWPGDRVLEIIGNDADLKEHWSRALELASSMTDDPKVPSGTRYDALRMLGVEPWEKRGAQLVRYLSDKNAELQMGAVSGIVDVDAPEATQALIRALPDLTEGNRKLAIAGLFRNRDRMRALKEALDSGKVERSVLTSEQLAKLESLEK